MGKARTAEEELVDLSELVDPSRLDLSERFDARYE